jgi:hypothetical protein
VERFTFVTGDGRGMVIEDGIAEYGHRLAPSRHGPRPVLEKDDAEECSAGL